MSLIQVDHNPEFRKLREEGYKLEIRGSLLLVKNVPYFKSANKEIEFGTLVCNIDQSRGEIIPPRSHIAYYIGEHPCDIEGNKITSIVNNSTRKNLGSDVIADHLFSSKPKPSGKYESYYHKVTTYIKIISQPVKEFYPNYKLKDLHPIILNQDSVFEYSDTNSSRAEINVVSEKLTGYKVGIIGLGGTGSYILDLIAKTPVSEIHLYDGDFFDQHNAFRAPGAASLNDLQRRISKVNYLREIYSKMHKHIFPHEVYISANNLDELSKLDFVFISIDKGSLKTDIFKFLEDSGIDFIDVGMGVNLIDGALIGMTRVTSSFGDRRDHIYNNNRVPFVDDQEEDEYSSNIQIADLNSINAAFAVIRWKKMLGFYKEVNSEYHQSYSTHLNKVNNGDF